jgi:hypothetical protein
VTKSTDKTDENVPAKPDSLREHMRKLTEAMPQELDTGSNKPKTSAPKRKVSDDTTDYIGEQMGVSPISVEIN